MLIIVMLTTCYNTVKDQLITATMAHNLPSTARSLPIALIRAREGVMLPIRDMLAETGITEQQWRVLRVLSPSLTRIATTLREKGLITQTRDDKDRRRQFIDITAKGQKIIDDNTDQAAHIVAGFKRILGKKDYETLLDLLARLDPNNVN